MLVCCCSVVQYSSVHLSFDPTRDHNVVDRVFWVMTKNWNRIDIGGARSIKRRSLNEREQYLFLFCIVPDAACPWYRLEPSRTPLWAPTPRCSCTSFARRWSCRQVSGCSWTVPIVRIVTLISIRTLSNNYTWTWSLPAFALCRLAGTWTSLAEHRWGPWASRFATATFQSTAFGDFGNMGWVFFRKLGYVMHV